MGADTTHHIRKPPSLDIWIIIFDKKVDRAEFEICSRAVDRASVPKNNYLKGDVAWRYVVGALMPQYALRQRHVPRRDWSFMKTKVIEGSGKPYVHLKRDPNEPQNSRPALGFSWAEVGAALVFAHSIGQKDVVINIGVGIHRKTPLVSAQAYILSKQHQLTKAEDEAVLSALSQYGEQRALSRLHMILALKDAYLRAMGQPVGFDLSRIHCDVGHQMFTVDGEHLSGWEFMVFDVDLGALKYEQIPPHDREYLVAVAVFRGGKGVSIMTPPADRETSMIHHFTVSEIVANVSRLGDYDNYPMAMPPVDQIPLSAKSSIQSFETITPTKPQGSSKHTSPEKLALIKAATAPIIPVHSKGGIVPFTAEYPKHR